MKKKVYTLYLLVALALTARPQTATDINEGLRLNYDGTSATFTMSWWGRAGRTYFIEQSGDLSYWDFLPIMEFGAENVISWGFLSNGDNMFLRLRYTDTSFADWETQEGLDPAVWADSSALAPSGNGLTLLRCFQLGINPNDYYEGLAPMLTVVSGDEQTGAPNGFIPTPLILSVTDSSGMPLVNAPVVISLTSGGGQLQASSSGSPSNTLNSVSDPNGLVTFFFQLPNLHLHTSHITASAGNFVPPSSVTFAEHTDDGSNGAYPSPFAPSNVTGTINSDGSEDITWQNNTDDQSSIPIWRQQSDGTWLQVDTVPAGTTSYHFLPP